MVCALLHLSCMYMYLSTQNYSVYTGTEALYSFFVVVISDIGNQYIAHGSLELEIFLP